MENDYIFCMNCGQKLPAVAKFCFACGQCVETVSNQDVVTVLKNAPCRQEDVGGSAENVTCRQEDMGSPAENVTCRQEDMGSSVENGGTLTLAEFRERASSQTGFREQLLAYRKSLPHSWDYNAYVGILLGAAERSATRLAAQQNYAVGQGDNRKNATNTIEMRGLVAVYEKYKSKNISSSILLSDVEDEIISIVPGYAEIGKKFHEIVFAEAGGEGKAKEDISEIIDFFVEMIAFHVLWFVANDKNIERADVKEKFLKWKGKFDICQGSQEKFEACFGTSAEAKWLYSARDILHCEIYCESLEYGEDYYIGYLPETLEKEVSLLQKLPEGKYGIAYYALARCYGVGIDRILGKLSGNTSFYVLRQNASEMIEYLVKAKKAQKPEKEALIDLGCIELSKGDYQKAKYIFETAKERGNQKASIYLRYIEHCEHAVLAINGQRIVGGGYGDYEPCQYIFGNIVEYKDRLYWMHKENSKKEIRLCSSGADGKTIVLASYSQEGRYFPITAADKGLNFSICNDLIYYEDGSGGISTMRLDGSDKRVLIKSKGNEFYRKELHMPMAFPEFLLYVDDYGQIWKRDQYGGKKIIRKMGDNVIVGVSEKEINLMNEELIDLRTLKRQKVEKKYPALKGKKVFYIDMAREIAYYEDNADAVNYKDKALVGVNTQGEIVDYWETPLNPYDHDYKSSTLYGTFCFNGQGLSVKIDHREMESIIANKYNEETHCKHTIEEYMELWKSQGLSEREWSYVAMFDRRGNRHLVSEIKREHQLGIFHVITKNGVVIFEWVHDDHNPWNTYYPFLPNGGIPTTKLDQLY